MKDGVDRTKIVEFPLTLCCSAVRSRTSSSTKREFWREDSPWHLNMQNTEAMTPIFRNVPQNVLYGIISEGRGRSNRGCWLTLDHQLFGCFSRRPFWTKREFWREDSPWHFKHAEYRSYDANISKCSSKCSISSHIWGTGSLEQRLLNCLWPCDLRVDVDVKDCHASRNFMEGALGSRLSMTFQRFRIPKQRVRYFHMLFNKIYEQIQFHNRDFSYLKDGVARAKVVQLLFCLEIFCCAFEGVSLTEEAKKSEESQKENQRRPFIFFILIQELDFRICIIYIN